MRTLAGLALSILLAGPALAGGLALPILEEEVEQQAAAGSRAGFLVPLLALVLIGIAVSGSDDPAPVDPKK